MEAGGLSHVVAFLPAPHELVLSRVALVKVHIPLSVHLPLLIMRHAENMAIQPRRYCLKVASKIRLWPLIN